MSKSKFLVSVLLASSIMAQSSWAQIATTQEVLTPSQSVGARATINTYMDRADVSEKLESLGINIATVKERVASLTNDEAANMAGKIDTLPAGGDAFGGIIGAAVFIFIVLLITDLLGWTKVFNFTRSIVR